MAGCFEVTRTRAIGERHAGKHYTRNVEQLSRKYMKKLWLVWLVAAPSTGCNHEAFHYATFSPSTVVYIANTARSMGHETSVTRTLTYGPQILRRMSPQKARSVVPRILLLDELAHLPHKVADGVHHLSKSRYRRATERLPAFDGVVVLEHQVKRGHL